MVLSVQRGFQMCLQASMITCSRYNANMERARHSRHNEHARLCTLLLIERLHLYSWHSKHSLELEVQVVLQ